jgi:hypothetical protein
LNAKLDKWASRQAEKLAACTEACEAAKVETPTLAASVQWAAPQIASVEVAPSELHSEILDLCSTTLGAVEDTRVKVRIAAVERVNLIVNAAFHGSGKAYLIGSAAAGLAIGSSDLDLTVLGSGRLLKTSRTSHNLYLLAGLLQQRGLAQSGGTLQVIERAKVPIVKFVERESGLAVDISVQQPDGLHSTAWMRAQLVGCPLLRPIVIVLKIFLANQQLNDPAVGGLGSYVLFVMTHGIVASSGCSDLGELLRRFLVCYSATHTKDGCWKIPSPLDGTDLGKKVKRTAEISAHFRALHAQLMVDEDDANELCYSHLNTGVCNFGAGCKFRHLEQEDYHPAPIRPDAPPSGGSRGLARLADAIQPRRAAPPTGSKRTQREETHPDGGDDPRGPPPEAKRRRWEVEEERPLSLGEDEASASSAWTSDHSYGCLGCGMVIGTWQRTLYHMQSCCPQLCAKKRGLMRRCRALATTEALSSEPDFSAPDFVPLGGYARKPHGWARNRPPCWRCGGPKAAKWCRCSGGDRR